MVTGNLKINTNNMPTEREKTIENRIKNYFKKNNIYFFNVNGNVFHGVVIPFFVA